MKNSIAVYPGTFDPFTRGHEDLVRRACNLFDRIIVGVAASTNKRPFFEQQERVWMAAEALRDLNNVSVLGFDGLLMDFIKQQNARIIMRGLRAVSDFEYEFQLAGMNRRLYPDVETIFLTPADEFMFVSATMVREVAQLGGDVSNFVPPHVAKHLQQKVYSKVGG